jgi:hypothetical protein
VIGRSLAGFFSRASAVLCARTMVASIHHVFVVAIACQLLENAIKSATLRPPAETLVYDLPVAETRGQITPGIPIRYL